MDRLASGVVRFPRRVIAVWVLLLILGGALSTQLPARVKDQGFSVAGSGSERALALSRQAFPHAPLAQAYVAVALPRASARALRDEMALAVRTARRQPGVQSIGRPVLAGDDRAAIAPVVLRGSIGTAQTFVAGIDAALHALRLEPSAQAELIGQAAVYEQYVTDSKRSLTISAAVSFPVTFAILVVAFLTVPAALVPLCLAATSLGVTFGLLYGLSFLFGLNVFVEDTVLVLGLALSIDFSLFMVLRIREEQGRGADAETAIARAYRSSGRAIAISGLTIAVALGGLFVTGVGIFASLAIGAIGAAILAALGALSLVPAIVLVAGARLERLPIGPAMAAARRATLWKALAQFVVRRRVPVVVGVTVVLVLLAVPASAVHVSFSTVSTFPHDDPVRRVSDAVARSFGAGATAPAMIVARGRGRELVQVLRSTPGVSAVRGPQSGRGGWRRAFATLTVAPDSAQARTLVGRMRARLATAFGRDAVVGGPTAEAADLVHRLDARTPAVVLVVLLAELLLLAIALRAPVLAIKAALMTLLSVGASVGIMVLIFGASIQYQVPLFFFATVFGLSTDYEVFLLTRVQEAHGRGATTFDSVRDGLLGSSRPISLAGTTMSVVFFAFALSPLLAFQQLGLGMGLAIVLDVTLVRALLAPAAIALLGQLNWWQPRLAPRAARAAAASRTAR